MDKTGIDLPGEAGTIMHQPDKIGQVELATISFGQSFQITPIELMTTVSSLINGGNRVTPHIGKEILNSDGTTKKQISFDTRTRYLYRERPLRHCRMLLGRRGI